jgi:ribosomal protein S18 acetylase RimI-like enzyme
VGRATSRSGGAIVGPVRRQNVAVDDEALDSPVWSALAGPHAYLAQTNGKAVRYPSEVSPFAALQPGGAEQAWADLAELIGPGGMALLAGEPVTLPEGWSIVGERHGVQLVDATLESAADPEAQVLGDADLPDMLDLVARTQPGPFAARTIDLGGYLGIRRDGKLAAMAGERLRLADFAEISAVCTDDAYRGLGLGTRLIRAVAAGIRERGQTPFLHAAGDNTSAIRLYLALGFEHRRDIAFQAVRAPGAVTQG